MTAKTTLNNDDDDDDVDDYEDRFKTFIKRLRLTLKMRKSVGGCISVKKLRVIAVAARVNSSSRRSREQYETYSF